MAVKQYNSTSDTSVSFPTGVVSPVTVEVWGAGGGGGSSNRSNRTGGGGGGGAYATSSVNVTGGVSYTIAVGGGGAGGNNNSNGTAGGNSHFNNNEVKGAGGQGGTRTAGSGAGGTTANSIGSTLYAGGAGGVGNNSNGYGGGGGAGAGSTGTGQSATLSVAGVGAGGGGNGGNGRATDINGDNGEIPGGGGGGAGNNTALPVGLGGSGANGSVKITYTVNPLTFQGQYGGTADISADAEVFIEGLQSLSGTISGTNSGFSGTLKFVINYQSLAGSFGSTAGFSGDSKRYEIEIVDPDNGTGTNYTSLYNWEAGKQKDLTASGGKISMAKCRCTGGTADGTNVTLTGWTTSATYHILITSEGSDRHNGVFDASKYRLSKGLNSGDSPNYTLLLIDCVYAKVVGLQFYTLGNSGSSAYQGCIAVYDSSTSYVTSDVWIEKCIFRGQVTSGKTQNVGIEFADKTGQNTQLYVYNNIFYDFDDSSGARCGLWRSSNEDFGSNLYAYNNTFHNCYNGILAEFANVIAKNNLVQDSSGSCYAGSYFDTDSEYNCDDDSTAPTTGRRTGEVLFLDEDGDNFKLSPNDTVAKEYGVSLNPDSDGWLSFSDDIIGNARPQDTSWDIGASEAVTAEEYISLAGRFGGNDYESASAKRSRLIEGTYGGSGYFSATTRISKKISGSYSGVGSFGATAKRYRLFEGEYSGIAYFGSTLSTGNVLNFAGTYSGLGTFSGTIKRQRAFESAFSGYGYFDAYGKRQRSFEGEYSGYGEFALASPKFDRKLNGKYNGLGEFVSDLGRIRNKIVDPDNGAGTNYTSLFNWEAGEEKSLSSNNEIAQATCRCTNGTADSTNVLIGALWESNSKNYIKIWTNPNETYRHNGTWQTGNKYRRNLIISGADLDSISIDIESAYIIIEGIEFYIQNGTTSKYSRGVLLSEGTLLLSNCLFNSYNLGTGGSLHCVYFTTGTNGKLKNILCYQTNPSAKLNTVGFVFIVNPAIVCYSCTSIGFQYGFIGNVAQNWKNCLTQNCVDGFFYTGTYSGIGTNNCSDVSSDAPGSNPQTGDVVFLDESIYDYRLSLNDTLAKENGTDLSTDPDGYLNVTDDIEGRSRPYKTNWDIGASEAHIWKLNGKYDGNGNFSFIVFNLFRRIMGQFSGVGQFSAFTRAVKKIYGAFDGLGHFSADMFEAGVQVLRGMFSADSTLSANAKRIRRFISLMDGLGTFSGTIVTGAVAILAGAFAGLSQWSGSIKRTRSFETIMSGLGSFSATIKSWTRFAGQFSGLATFSGNILTGAITALAGIFSGLGSFSATARRVRFLHSAFAGLGSFSGRVKRTLRIAGEYSGLGTFVASLKKRMRIVGQFSGNAYISARMTLRMVLKAILSALGSFSAYAGTTTAEEAEGLFSGTGTFRGNLGRIIAGLTSPSFLKKSKIRTQLRESSTVHDVMLKKSKIKELVDE